MPLETACDMTVWSSTSPEANCQPNSPTTSGSPFVADRLVADVDHDVVLLADQRALLTDPVADGLVERGGGPVLAVPGGVVHLQDADQPVLLAQGDHVGHVGGRTPPLAAAQHHA